MNGVHCSSRPMRVDVATPRVWTSATIILSSDVSEIPEETYPLLADSDLLIMDALRPDRSSSTHFGLPKDLEEVRKIKPKRTLFTGMMHLMDHDIVNEYLATLIKSEGLDVQHSYDGLSVPDMACDTFLKIVQNCKRKFVLVKVGENEPFVYELLTGLPTTIMDLERHQIHICYESICCMLKLE